MILLGLDTSTVCTSVAIADASSVLAHVEHRGSRDHGAFLAPAIVDCLSRAGLDVADLEGVAVGIGPGLYTGLRVGMATAMALAEARGIPIVGVSGLDVLAHAAPRCAVITTIDARRAQVFWARYGPSDGGVRARLDGPRVSGRDELDVAIAQLTGADPVDAVSTAVVGEVAGAGLTHPDARDLLALARPLLVAGGGRGEPPVPLYLREADVRIGWAERGGGRGGRGGDVAGDVAGDVGGPA
jgi:tRNA threonylcarbamoyladenosine biosynthesis protein TsaB